MVTEVFGTRQCDGCQTFELYRLTSTARARASEWMEDSEVEVEVEEDCGGNVSAGVMT
jgi:hypothetical protein